MVNLTNKVDWLSIKITVKLITVLIETLNLFNLGDKRKTLKLGRSYRTFIVLQTASSASASASIYETFTAST